MFFTFRMFIFVLFFMIVISMFFMFQEVYFVLFFMIVISMFSMFQEVSFVLFFMIVISMFFMFQEVYFCTVLYNCNFYVLYVPGSLFLYCSLWMQFLCYLCSRKVIFVLFFIIVISMFFMFQEVYFCTVLYDCNFYVLYVPGSLLLYCSLWL